MASLVHVPPPEVPTDPPSSSTTTTKKRKKKKKKSGAGGASGGADDSGPAANAGLSMKKRLFLKKSAKRTPWYDADELLETGRDLCLALKLFSPSSSPSAAAPARRQFDDGDDNVGAAQIQPPPGLSFDEHQRLRASLRRVAVWRGRSDRGGRMPHAVDVSAGLAEILLTDAERSGGGGPLASSSYQLRGAYSTLLLRSVNGLADTYRHQKTSAALSVSHCCNIAGLPAWIVDVRHDASHNELPGLGVCRIASLESLRFWKGKYWDALEGRLWGSLPPAKGGESGGEAASGGSEEGGVCTLAYDCLKRYQAAAIAEDLEREERSQMSRKEKHRQHQQRQQQFDASNGKDNVLSGLVDVVMEEEDPETDAKDEQTQPNKMRKEKSDAADTKNAGGVASRGPIPWSVLIDEKPKKKRKKIDKNPQSQEGKGDGMQGSGRTAAGVGSGPSGASTKTQPKLPPSTTSAVSTPSSRDCAAEFIKTVPLDIAFSSTLRFLVWGQSPPHPIIDGDEGLDALDAREVNGKSGVSPALVTLPASTREPTQSQDFQAQFDRLRAMNTPLLIAMTSAYPGFAPALLMHVVDAIICMDDAQRSFGESCITVDGNGGGSIDLKLLADNIEYLSRWVRYILSREYHMHFDRLVAMYDPATLQQHNGNNVLVSHETSPQPEPADRDLRPGESETPTPPKPVDLKKKGKKKWSLTEAEFMECPVERSRLCEIGLPMNSICDRLRSHLRDAADGADSSSVARLAQFLEYVVGEDRVANMGIYDYRHTETSADGIDHVGGGNSVDVANANVPLPGESLEKWCPSDGSNQDHSSMGAVNESKVIPQESEMMSLEDMEAMLGGNDTRNKDSAASVAEPQLTDRTEGHSVTSPIIRPWTLCTAWDTCAIGTLPGYPS